MTALRTILGGTLMLVHLLAGSAWSAQDKTGIAEGKRIYTEGILPGGNPVQAIGASGLRVAGQAAACIQCHRPSGLGQVEGDFPVPPITGRALFGPARSVVVNADRVRGKTFNLSHEPYTETDFGKLVRDGVAPDGRMLAQEMPRYAFDGQALMALKAYLETLSAASDPGVEPSRIRFATVVTPDVDPQVRSAFLATIEAAVRTKNANTMPGRRHMVNAAEFAMVTERHWDLSIWQLEGKPETWGAQLDSRLEREPVFALLSGLTSDLWDPVHRFCERRHIPCWFPSVPLAPDDADEGGYSLYFQKGVTLEAELIASALNGAAAPIGKVVQIIDGKAVAARQGAERLKAILERSAARMEMHVLKDLSDRSMAEAARAIEGAGKVVVWAGEEALTRLSTTVRVRRSGVFLSSVLARPERLKLPQSWGSVLVAYPYEHPARRAINVSYFRHWIGRAGVPVLDEPLQNEAYFAVSFLSETIAEMLGNLHRDYLIERAETMLGRRESRKAEDEARDAQLLRRYATQHPMAVHGAEGRRLGSREGTTVYPALSLGPGQRFASRGGYVIALASLTSAGPIPRWSVPNQEKSTPINPPPERQTP